MFHIDNQCLPFPHSSAVSGALFGFTTPGVSTLFLEKVVGIFSFESLVLCPPARWCLVNEPA